MKDKCVLCGAEFESIYDRHNPYPVAEEGDCCGMCNEMIVIPERFRRISAVGNLNKEEAIQ